jgi:hypothetical protein
MRGSSLTRATLPDVDYMFRRYSPPTW